MCFVRRLAFLLGGRISVSSASKRGVQIVLRMPVEPAFAVAA
jgi:chemotaxis protein histidine kinase CheA